MKIMIDTETLFILVSEAMIEGIGQVISSAIVIAGAIEKSGVLHPLFNLDKKAV